MHDLLILKNDLPLGSLARARTIVILQVPRPRGTELFTVGLLYE